jgi:hypothetical protein
MKKSRTTMKVPDRRTGSAAQRLASAGDDERLAATANVGELGCVVMPMTVPVGMRAVDYPAGNRHGVGYLGGNEAEITGEVVVSPG